MSSGGAHPPPSFNPFPYLFPSQPHFFTPNQRIKMKRQRQRVDAGEPRNSYQQPRVPPKQENGSPIQLATAIPLNVNQLFPSWMQMANDLSEKKTEPEEGMQSIEESHVNEKDEGLDDAPVSNASATESTSTSISSSSRRKTNAPRKNSPSLEDPNEDEVVENEAEVTRASKLDRIVEAQKALYSSIIEQQKMGEGKLANDLSMMGAFLRQAILTNVVGSIDGIVNQWIETEQNKVDGDDWKDQSNSIKTITGGIFPPNPFVGLNLEKNSRKRKSSSISRDNDDNKIPTSLFNYFPGAMSSIFDKNRLAGNSPSVSEDNSDYDLDDPDCQLSGADLKKSKLMFFYTRYPNPTNLKQYFPDFQFRKKSSGQLVKWFSNYREFYYLQMEKFAKEAVARGIKNREEIIVTRDSELFKQLNQHYNKNNHFEAPDRFIWVAQETLREFHEAISLGKHNEPSWKKEIYKIIRILDDPIPDFFKEHSFLDRLEQQI